MIMLRLKPSMSALISKSQCAFVHGRSIFYNVIIAHEVAPSMKNKRTGHVGFVGAKLDISKAYDRIEWSFTEGLLVTIGFYAKWVTLIMNYISFVSFSLLLNGRRCDSFIPSRGILCKKTLCLLIYLFFVLKDCLAYLMIW